MSNQKRRKETTAHGWVVIAALLTVVAGATAVHLRTSSAALFDPDIPQAPTCDVSDIPSARTRAAHGDPAPISTKAFERWSFNGQNVISLFIAHLNDAATGPAVRSKHGYVSFDYGLLPPPGKEPAALPLSYSAWDEAARALPRLVRSKRAGEVKEYLKDLPVLAAPPCDGDSPGGPCLEDIYLTRAHVILTHLAAVYIYYDTTVFRHPKEPGEIDHDLPEALATPLEEVGRRLQRRDGMDSTLPNHRFSWADFFTMNVVYSADHIQPKNKFFQVVLEPEHVSPAVSFVGGPCEDSFIRTTLVQSGPLFGKVVNLIWVSTGLVTRMGDSTGELRLLDLDRFISAFKDLAGAIHNMAKAFDIINNTTCDDTTAEWWNEVGVWAQAAAPNFGPNGLQFVPMLVMDAFFGRRIMSSDLGKAVAPNINALLANHRQLLDVILQAPSIPSFIERLQAVMKSNFHYPPRILETIESYNKANDAYAKWLARHRQVAQRFIHLGAVYGKPRGTSGGTMRSDEKALPDHSGGNVKSDDSDDRFLRAQVEKERDIVQRMETRHVNDFKCPSSMGKVEVVASIGNLLQRSLSERFLSTADTCMLADYTSTLDDASGALGVKIRTKNTVTSNVFGPLDVIAVLQSPELEHRRKLLRALGGDMETVVRLDQMEWVDRIRGLRNLHSEDPLWSGASTARSYQEQCLERMCDGVQVRLWDVLTMMQMRPVSRAVGKHLFDHWHAMKRNDIYVDCAQAIVNHFVEGMSWVDIVDLVGKVSSLCMDKLPIHEIADLATWRKFSVYEIDGMVSPVGLIDSKDNNELGIVMHPMQYTLDDPTDDGLHYQEDGLIWHAFSNHHNGRTIVARTTTYAFLRKLFLAKLDGVGTSRILAFASGSTWILFRSVMVTAGKLKDGSGMSLWILASTFNDVVYLDKLLEAAEHYIESLSVTMVLSRASERDCSAWAESRKGKVGNVKVICRGNSNKRGYGLFKAALEDEGVFRGSFDVRNLPTGRFAEWFGSNGCFAFPIWDSPPSPRSGVDFLTLDMLKASKPSFRVGIVGKAAFGHTIAEVVKDEIEGSRLSGVTVTIDMMKEAGLWAEELYDSSIQSHSTRRGDSLKRFTCEVMSRLRNDRICLVSFHGSVYDITEYNERNFHPGSTLVPYCGEDITDLFALAMHSSSAIDMLETLRVGVLTTEAQGTVESAGDFEPIHLSDATYEHVYLLADVSIHRGSGEELPAVRSCASQRDIVAIVEGGLYFRHALAKVAAEDRGFSSYYDFGLVLPFTKLMDLQLDPDERGLSLTTPCSGGGTYFIQIAAKGPQRFTPKDFLDQLRNRFQPFAKRSVDTRADMDPYGVSRKDAADLVCHDVEANFSVDSPPYTCSESDILCQATLNAILNIVKTRWSEDAGPRNIARRLYVKWPRQSGSHDDKVDLCLGELRGLSVERPDWIRGYQKEPAPPEREAVILGEAAEHCVAFMDLIPLWTGLCSPELVQEDIDYSLNFDKCMSSLLEKAKHPERRCGSLWEKK